MVLFGWQRFTPWQTSEKTEDLVVHRFKTLELCNAAWGISKMNSDKAENGMQARIHAVSRSFTWLRHRPSVPLTWPVTWPSSPGGYCECRCGEGQGHEPTGEFGSCQRLLFDQ